MLNQSREQRCRCPKKLLMLALMHHSQNRTSITKATTVNKTPSPFSAILVVSLASSLGIIDIIFRLGRQDHQRLKKRGTLTRRSHLYLRKRTNHHHLKKKLRTKDKRNFNQVWSMGLLFLTSFTIWPGVRTYPL